MATGHHAGLDRKQLCWGVTMSTQTFSKWLVDKNIDANELAPELRAALIAQWVGEQMRLAPPATVLVIPDDTPEERWQRAVRMELRS